MVIKYFFAPLAQLLKFFFRQPISTRRQTFFDGFRLRPDKSFVPMIGIKERSRDFVRIIQYNLPAYLFVALEIDFLENPT